ncbi:MAG: hypothetical protein AB4426_19580 [Xenococcaceae cyanobacterium]
MGNLDWLKQQLQMLTLEELEVVEGWIQQQKQVIFEASSQSKKTQPLSKRPVVRTLMGFTPDGQEALWQLEYVRCGKQRCHKCARGEGHGPYWYYYWRETTHSKLKSRYWGKRNPLL